MYSDKFMDSARDDSLFCKFFLRLNSFLDFKLKPNVGVEQVGKFEPSLQLHYFSILYFAISFYIIQMSDGKEADIVNC